MSLADELEQVVERAVAQALERYVERIPAALEQALSAREQDKFISIKELAVLMGRSECGVRTFLSRPQGAPLREVAMLHGGALRWRKHEAISVLESMNARRRRKAA